MDYSVYPNSKTDNCFLFVGGFGDKGEDYEDLIKLLQIRLPKYVFCTFTLSQVGQNYDDLLSIQTVELEQVVDSLINQEKFHIITIYASSMGAFATTKLVTNPKYDQYIDQVLYFDPADYYLEDNYVRPSGSITWAGYEVFSPDKPTVSSLLAGITSNAKINVVHFKIKNHGANGYCCDKLIERGINHKGYYSRLNTDMVKNFFFNTPVNNRGKYIEVDNLPHGYFRDGNIKQNTTNLATLIVNIIQHEHQRQT